MKILILICIASITTILLTIAVLTIHYSIQTVIKERTVKKEIKKIKKRLIKRKENNVEFIMAEFEKGLNQYSNLN